MVTRSTGLEVAVLTSSSPQPLDVLIDSIRSDEVDALELYVFRSADMRSFVEQGVLPARSWFTADPAFTDAARLVARLSDRDIRRIGDHILSAIAPRYGDQTPLRVSALATFFPEITSSDKQRRSIAVDALTNTAKLATHLGARCVEFVGGTRLEPCGCGVFRPQGHCARVRCFPVETKLRWLVEGFTSLLGSRDCADICFAAEVETDRYSVLNGTDSLSRLILDLDASFPHRVGVNLDYAHAFINGITARDLQRSHLSDKLVNAHISDTAGAHLQDLVPGTYHRVVHMPADSGSHPMTFSEEFTSLLWQRVEHPNGLYFTGAISVELEFNSWVDWLRTAIRKTRYLVEHTRPERDCLASETLQC